MKKFWILLFTVILLTGCAKPENMETIWIQDDPAEPIYENITLNLPKEASAEAIEQNSTVKVYRCENYEIYVETRASGNIEKTIETMTGISLENLTILKTRSGFCNRYDFTWCAAGEQGEIVGRGAVLDDGAGHYCLTVLTPSDHAKELKESWNNLFQSFELAS